MNPASQDIANLLQASSELTLTIGTDLFIGREPSSPADCVTVFDTVGSTPDVSLDTLEYDRPSVQIRVRAVDYLNGYSLISDIKKALQAFNNTLQGGSYYASILVSSGPYLLDYDDNNRPRFIVNFNIQRR